MTAGVAAADEIRAILIGVSDYPDEIGQQDLKGPANDVRLMRDVMIERGAQDVTILADQVEGGAPPTRAAILAAFAHMADRAGAGDLVYVHMSGHGTRQVDLQGDETDGLDEVFLPADVGRAAPGAQQIPGAITDDEIGAALRAIRETGADVWLVVDTCHAGTALRGAGDAFAARFVDPSDLGLEIPVNRRDEPAVIENAGPEPAGRLLAFYAARSSELAMELPFRGDAGETQWYGLFTAKLAARLQSQTALTYRQLFQAVLSDLNQNAVPGAARLQTPSWEGNLIDAAVFDGQSSVGIQRFAVTGSRIEAGLLHGLEDGTVVGLVADAADPEDALLGVAQLRRTTALRARLTPVAGSCVARTSAPCARVGMIADTARFAQVIAQPLDLSVRLAPPRSIGEAGNAIDPVAQAALQEAVASIDTTLEAPVVFDDKAYTVDVAFDGTHFWFGQRAEIGAHPVGLRVLPQKELLVRALIRIRRAETFARLLASVAGRSDPLARPPVSVDLTLVHSDLSRLEPPGSLMDPREECAFAWQESPDPPEPFPQRATLKQCDRWRLTVQGTAPGARDVNRVYINGQYCVAVSHELIEDAAAPRQIGAEMASCSECPDGYAAGHERMFVIATDVENNAAPFNLTRMLGSCQPLDTVSRGTDMTAEEAALFDFLGNAVTMHGTRGAFGISARQVWVKQFDWAVLPREEAFARAGITPQ